MVNKLIAHNVLAELIPKFSPVSTGPRIMQGKTNIRRNSKMYDELGNDINRQDADIMNDLARGKKYVKHDKETIYDEGSKGDKTMS